MNYQKGKLPRKTLTEELNPRFLKRNQFDWRTKAKSVALSVKLYNKWSMPGGTLHIFSPMTRHNNKKFDRDLAGWIVSIATEKKELHNREESISGAILISEKPRFWIQRSKHVESHRIPHVLVWSKWFRTSNQIKPVVTEKYGIEGGDETEKTEPFGLPRFSWKLWNHYWLKNILVFKCNGLDRRLWWH